MSAPDASVVCQMCSATNPAQARYCLNCGTRLVPAGADTAADAAAFEDALAAVFSEPDASTPAPTPVSASPATTTWTPAPAADAWTPTSAPPATSGTAPTDSCDTPGTWGEPTPAAPTTDTQQGTWATAGSGTSGGTGDWGSAGQAPQQGWPTVDDVRKPRRWPWVILAVVGALVFCCCGLAGIGLVADQSAALGTVMPYA